MNLEGVLHELHHQLVSRGFAEPAHGSAYVEAEDDISPRCVKPIETFRNWILSTPEALSILRAMGEWSLPTK